MGWSGPPSFVSSSGPSSPGVSDPYSNSKESSEMSSSVVSSDGAMVDNLSHIFLADLNQDLESIGILLQSEKQVTGSMEFSDYFTNLQRSQHIKHDHSGDVTPISERSKVEMLGNIPVARNAASYCDITVMDDTDSTISDEILHQTHTDIMSKTALTANSADASDVFLGGCVTPRSFDLSSIENSYKNVSCSGNSIKLSNFDNSSQSDSASSKIGQNMASASKQVKLFEKDIRGSRHNLGSDKWCASKEVFLDMSKKDVYKQNPKLGAVVVKESYIEPPRISRVSKSLDGKSQASQSFLNIAVIPRRASDGIPLASSIQPDNLQSDSKCLSSENCVPEKAACSYKRPLVLTHLSHPGDAKSSKSGLEYKKSSSSNDNVQARPRFTTTIVNERQHFTEMTFRPQENRSVVNDGTFSKTNQNDF